MHLCRTQLLAAATSLERAERLAPEQPPCFDSRREWVEYLAWAIQANEVDVVVLLRPPGVRFAFNRCVNFCADCTGRRRDAMLDAGRCDPQWLLREPDWAA